MSAVAGRGPATRPHATFPTHPSTGVRAAAGPVPGGSVPSAPGEDDHPDTARGRRRAGSPESPEPDPAPRHLLQCHRASGVPAGLPAGQTQPQSQLCPPLGTAEPRFPRPSPGTEAERLGGWGPAAASTPLRAGPVNAGSVTDPSGCSKHHGQHHLVAAERL